MERVGFFFFKQKAENTSREPMKKILLLKFLVGEEVMLSP